MKKTIIFLTVFALFLGMGMGTGLAVEKNSQHFSAQKIEIVLLDGSLYKMTEGDKARFDFFLKTEPMKNVKSVLIDVVDTFHDGKIVRARVLINGEKSPREGLVRLFDKSLVDMAILAIETALE